MGDEEKKQYSVNVFGSCVSRNPFNSDKGLHFHVRTFVQRHNQLLLDQPGLPDALTDDDVELLKSYLESINARGMREIVDHMFNVRMLKSLFNGSARDLVLEKKGEWIVLDPFYMFADDLLVIRKGDLRYYVKTDKTFSYLVRAVVEHNPKYSGYAIESVEASLNTDYYLDRMCSFIENNWGSNVVLIDGRPAQFSEAGGKLTRVKESPFASAECEVFIGKVASKVKCHVIWMPRILVSNDDLMVHYTERYMDYLKEQIDIIIAGDDSEKAYVSRTKCSEYAEERLSEYIEERQREAEILMSLTDDPLMKTCLELASDSDPGHYHSLSKSAMENGNIGLAIQLERFAARHHVRGSRTALGELLCKAGQFEEAFAMLKMEADSGNPSAMFALGKMYREGQGVASDLKIASDLFRSSANKGHKWAKTELIITLGMVGTAESAIEMFECCKRYSSEGNGHAMLMLGRCYRDGIGTETNSIEAKKWFDSALSNGVIVESKEYKSLKKH